MDKSITKNEKEPKGRLSWLIPVLEIIVMIAYLLIGFKGIIKALKTFNFAGMFESVSVAIWFLNIATIILTVLCFIPLFKSRQTPNGRCEYNMANNYLYWIIKK